MSNTFIRIKKILQPFKGISIVGMGGLLYGGFMICVASPLLLSFLANLFLPGEKLGRFDFFSSLINVLIFASTMMPILWFLYTVVSDEAKQPSVSPELSRSLNLLRRKVISCFMSLIFVLPLIFVVKIEFYGKALTAFLNIIIEFIILFAASNLIFIAMFIFFLNTKLSQSKNSVK
jgi:hypothetical protein